MGGPTCVNECPAHHEKYSLTTIFYMDNLKCHFIKTLTKNRRSLTQAPFFSTQRWINSLGTAHQRWAALLGSMNALHTKKIPIYNFLHESFEKCHIKNITKIEDH